MAAKSNYKGNGKFFGEVSSNAFIIKPVSGERDAGIPIIEGEIEHRDSYSIITVTSALNKRDMAFLYLQIVIFSALIIGKLFFPSYYPWAIVIPIAFLIIGPSTIILIYKNSTAESITFLQKLLKAEIIK